MTNAEENLKFFDDYKDVYTLSEMKDRLVVLLDLDEYDLLSTRIRNNLLQRKSKQSVRKFITAFNNLVFKY